VCDQETLRDEEAIAHAGLPCPSKEEEEDEKGKTEHFSLLFSHTQNN
jgi:hypothetical protein